jgi:glucose-6-phosphate 1-dehydrogenase
MKETKLVIFGGTGDLMKKKIAPALATLFERGELPPALQCIGIGRTEYTDDSYRTMIAESVQTLIGIIPADTFLNMFTYVQGDFHDTAPYMQIKQLCSTPVSRVSGTDIIYYFSVDPQYYETIASQLQQNDLAQIPDTRTSVMVEKPIGYDTHTAEKVEAGLRAVFDESQIYRIEHYLAKETIRYIPTFRFTYGAYESLWNPQTITHITIDLWETKGVETRGAFYESVGALRDVGQNHLLQALAVTCMQKSNDGNVSSARSRILENLPILTESEVVENTRRFQYDTYRTIPQVNPHSTVETAFAVTASLQDQWNGVTILLRSGKRIGIAQKGITVGFRHGTLDPLNTAQTVKSITFEIEPEEVIRIQTEQNGVLSQIAIPVQRTTEKSYQYVQEYSKIIKDGIDGKRTYSVSHEEVIAMWRFIDPITAVWKSGLVPLIQYPRDTNPFF